MSEKNVNNVAGPMADAWKKGLEENMARVQSGFEELAKLEQMATEQTRVLLNDIARLQQEGLTWATKVNAEWRKVGMDAFRKSAELFTPKA